MPVAALNGGENVALLRYTLLVDALVEAVDGVVGDPLKLPSFWPGVPWRNVGTPHGVDARRRRVAFVERWF
jgi:hypothetical protein